MQFWNKKLQICIIIIKTLILADNQNIMPQQQQKNYIIFIISSWFMSKLVPGHALMRFPTDFLQSYFKSCFSAGVCGLGLMACRTLDSTSSCTMVLVVSSTRTVCSSLSSSSPFSISCHSMLMMFPAAACKHTH